MAFVPVKSDHGAVLPFEYLPAAAGDYHVGQLVEVRNGEVTALSAAAATTPPYLCMHEGKKEKGDLLPVTRVSRDYIYETTLETAVETAAIGAKLSVAAGGLAPAAAEGTFEIVSLDGKEAGDVVRGRWVPAPAAASGGSGG